MSEKESVIIQMEEGEEKVDPITAGEQMMTAEQKENSKRDEEEYDARNIDQKLLNICDLKYSENEYSAISHHQRYLQKIKGKVGNFWLSMEVFGKNNGEDIAKHYVMVDWSVEKDELPEKVFSQEEMRMLFDRIKDVAKFQTRQKTRRSEPWESIESSKTEHVMDPLVSELFEVVGIKTSKNDSEQIEKAREEIDKP